MNAPSPDAVVNEPVLAYEPESPERLALHEELVRQASGLADITPVIDGRPAAPDDARMRSVTMPHTHARAIANVREADAPTVERAIAACSSAAHDWGRWSQQERSAVFLKAADLLAGPWRARLNAATMLGQSKTIHQAEIDAACELTDFLRFNVRFAEQIGELQPISSPGVRNRLDYRPLEGFVYAVTPFNFTAIGGNLALAPALMGNTVLWKPAATALASNALVMELLREAGLPDGVINFVPGDAAMVSDVALRHPHLAGIHFTGSTAVFDKLWAATAAGLTRYRSYPRLVGETGGKDFVLAHPSADLDALAVALLRGAFEYQGQKCSAASRAYVPKSLWPRLRARLVDLVETIRMGDVCDFTNFMGAVIDANAFRRIVGFQERAALDPTVKRVAGGGSDDRIGYFVQPTIYEVEDPMHELMREEIFGPVLTIFVYPDNGWDEVLRLVDVTSPYGLTGSVFARERDAIRMADGALRHAAGNFYVNDKPTGAVVGQQPFGGARRSGTNDKAGSALNLLRWVSPRTIKETTIPAIAYPYPHMRK